MKSKNNLLIRLMSKFSFRYGVFQKGIAQLPVVLVLVLMAIAIPATLKLTQSTTDSRSSAATSAPGCSYGFTETRVYGECCGCELAKEVRECVNPSGTLEYKSSACDHDSSSCQGGCGTACEATTRDYNECCGCGEVKRVREHQGTDCNKWWETLEDCHSSTTACQDYNCVVVPTETPRPTSPPATSTPSCSIGEHELCYDQCVECCPGGNYYELYGDYYCGEDDVQLPTPMFEITPPAGNACNSAGGSCYPASHICGNYGQESLGLDCGNASLHCCKPTDNACNGAGGSCYPASHICGNHGQATLGLDCGDDGVNCCVPEPVEQCWCVNAGTGCGTGCQWSTTNPFGSFGGACDVSHCEDESGNEIDRCYCHEDCGNQCLLAPSNPYYYSGGGVICDYQDCVETAPTSTPSCIAEGQICYEDCARCCDDDYHEVGGDYYCGSTVLPTSSPAFTITPRPRATNTPVPLPTNVGPGEPTNTPVPLPTNPGTQPTSPPSPGTCSEPSGILARVQRDETDPLREFISMEAGTAIRLVCVSGQEVRPANDARLVVDGPNGYHEIYLRAIHEAWTPSASGDYTFYCESRDSDCDGLRSNTAAITVSGETAPGMCFRCPNEGEEGIIGVTGGDFDCTNEITMDDTALWVREYNDTLVNGAQEGRMADVDCDGEATVDDLAVWIRAFRGGQ